MVEEEEVEEEVAELFFFLEDFAMKCQKMVYIYD